MKDFENINWLLVSERFNQYLRSNAFKFFKETCLLYFYDIYRQSGHNQANTRSCVLKLKHPLRSTCSGQKVLALSDTNSLEQFTDRDEVGEFS